MLHYVINSTEDVDKKTPAEEIRQKAIADRNKKLADRKTALEAQKKKMVEDREAARKAKESKTDKKE